MRLPTILVGKSLLLIGHDSNASNRLQTLLQQYEMTVTVTHCPQEATSLVRRNAYDLVLLDTPLPGARWLPTVHGLRNEHIGGSLPIVALVEDPVGYAADLRGIDAVVAKPVVTAVLLDRLAGAMDCACSAQVRPFDVERVLGDVFSLARNTHCTL